jgi:hypothetical protein
LQGRLGAEDRRRIDQHMTGVRELEARLTAAPTPTVAMCSPPANTGALPGAMPDRHAEPSKPINAAMSDLMAYALSCDLTRSFVLQFSFESAHLYYRELGQSEQVHDVLAHTEPDPQPKYHASIVYNMECLAYFLERLQATPDGAGNLLDHSCILVNTCVAWGKPHSTNDWPFLIAGKAGGKLKGNYHYRSASKENSARVPFTAMQAAGVNLASWGEKTFQVNQPIADILAS